MANKQKWIDAVEMSRSLRIETGKELAPMSPQDRIRFLNGFAKNDPVLRKMKRTADQRTARTRPMSWRS